MGQIRLDREIIVVDIPKQKEITLKEKEKWCKMQSLIECVIDVIDESIVKIYPFLGLGKPIALLMDELVTKEYDRLLQQALCSGYNVQVLSAEGERDGILCSEIQTFEDNADRPSLIIAVDPIDGTLTGSRGGSRCLSVVGMSKNKKEKSYKKLPDRLSCFYAGSQDDGKFLEHLCTDGDKIGLKNFEKDFLELNISTLHRAETKELFASLLGLSIDEFETRYRFSIGERTFYRPNMAFRKIFYAGDTSISLPLETRNFIGRTGIAEARLEAGMWKYWKGLIVSGSKMKRYEGGQIKYLVDRIKCAHSGKETDILNLFEEAEIAEMLNYGWNLGDIAGFLEKDEFTPDFDFTCIASITGTQDRNLKYEPQASLKPCTFIPEENSIFYEMWIIENGLIKKVERECSINIIYGKERSAYILDWYKMGSWAEVFSRSMLQTSNSSSQFQSLSLLAKMERGENMQKEDVKI